MTRVIIRGGKPLVGRVEVPADKSITHRGLLFAALAEGTSTVRAYRPGADNRSSAACVAQLGVTVDGEAGAWSVTSAGFDHWKAPTEALDCGNSGTTMRLLGGMVAGRGLDVTLCGDASLTGRPMARISKPLRTLGLSIEGEGDDGRERPPLRVCAGTPEGGAVQSAIASAQVKSALLLAGVTAGIPVKVTEPHLSRDHTERMLLSMGANIERGVDEAGRPFAAYTPGASLKPLTLTSPGDVSSAAFLLAAGALIPGSRVTAAHVGLNPTRTGVLDVLRGLGAEITESEAGDTGGEPVGALTVTHGALTATATHVGDAIIPRLVDELVVLAAVFAGSRGRTVVRDAAELKVKESDRIAETVKLLAAFGLRAEATDDGYIIEGPQTPTAATVDVGGDHRLAMTAAVLALWADGESVLTGFDIAEVSYPGFVEDLRDLGAHIDTP